MGGWGRTAQGGCERGDLRIEGSTESGVSPRDVCSVTPFHAEMAQSSAASAWPRREGRCKFHKEDGRRPSPEGGYKIEVDYLCHRSFATPHTARIWDPSPFSPASSRRQKNRALFLSSSAQGRERGRNLSHGGKHTASRVAQTGGFSVWQGAETHKSSAMRYSIICLAQATSANGDPHD